jgi:hypothetical protein
MTVRRALSPDATGKPVKHRDGKTGTIRQAYPEGASIGPRFLVEWQDDDGVRHWSVWLQDDCEVGT